MKARGEIVRNIYDESGFLNVEEEDGGDILKSIKRRLRRNVDSKIRTTYRNEVEDNLKEKK